MGVKHDVEAPNITGEVTHWAYGDEAAKGDPSGAFSTSGNNVRAYNASGVNWGFRIYLDASKSNQIYGPNSEIRPMSIGALPCIHI